MLSSRFAFYAVAALWALGCSSIANAQTATPAPAAAPAPAAGPPRPDLNVKARGPIRSIDLPSFPADKFRAEFAAGPSSGLDSGIVGLTRVPPNGGGPGLHKHSVDQIYFVLKGAMTLQLGTEEFTAGANTVVLIPAGTPHRNWNASAEEEVHLELIMPAPLDQLVQPTEPQKVENAAALIRSVANTPRATDPVAGASRSWWLARRETGSQHVGIHYDEIDPKSGDRGLHIHAFDQVYFVMEGTMNVQVGVKTYEVKPNTFVIIPAGTVHRAWNEGPGVGKRLSLMMLEPAKGETFEIPVQMKAQSRR